jgi:Tfp pilus assembly protein PilW
MRLSERIRPADEDGTTMVELLVGLAMGMIVVAGLAMLLMVTLRGNARVDARVEATDNGRVAMARIMEQLHSACAMPQHAPVQEASTGLNLVFWHQPYGKANEAGQLPIWTELKYSPTTKILTEVDKEATGGTGPSWEWGTPKSSTLFSNVSPETTGGPIFSYYKYVNGEISAAIPSSSTTTELKESAAVTTLVYVTLKTSPRSQPVTDSGVAATIQNGATLRLTPPALVEGTSLPCR